MLKKFGFKLLIRMLHTIEDALLATSHRLAPFGRATNDTQSMIKRHDYLLMQATCSTSRLHSFAPSRVASVDFATLVLCFITSLEPLLLSLLHVFRLHTLLPFLDNISIIVKQAAGIV
jgi:hypothetical protein